MKNNIFFKSTFILLIGGSITKILGFLLKIVITRNIGEEGIGLYSLIMPTYNLLMTLSICSYPIAVSKVVAESRYRSKNIILSIIPISIVINIITILFVILISPIISNVFLKEPRVFYPIIVCSLTLPFISLSSIVKGYFWGKQTMIPYMVSNVLEQVARIIIIILLMPFVIKKGIVITVSFIIGVNIISESISIVIMLLFVPKNAIFNTKDIKLSNDIIRDVYSISIPSTSSKIVGSIFYFLEPIILTNTLLHMGYTNEYIVLEYGIINGYSLALLLLPSFFTQSISTSLVAEVSKQYKLGNKRLCKRRIKQIIILSLSIGLIFTLIILFNTSFFLNIIFDTNKGINYIKVLSPFILIYYINGPIVTSLQALNKSKANLFNTLFCSSMKLLIIFITSLLHIGLYSLIIGIIFNLISSLILNIKTLKKALN